MFEISSKKIDLWKQNVCKKKNISLNKDLDCFIVVNSDNEKFIDLTIRNILDYIIDKIWLENTYKEFSIALEDINSFVKTWKLDSKNETKIDIFIWILNKNNFMFSNMWECSCFLIKEDNEVIELINKKDNKKEFSFISNWELKENEIIFISSNIILDYLTYSDIVDWLNWWRDLDWFNQNIDNILRREIIEDNIVVTTLKYNPISYENIEYQRNNNSLSSKIINLDKIKNLKITKNIFNFMNKNKEDIIEKYNKSPKKVKNILIIIWIIISLLLMYKILFNVVSITTISNEKETATIELNEAIWFVQIASENILNPDIFEINIDNATEIISKIEEQNLFLVDTTKLNDDINILKKQFNKIEIFSDDPNLALYTWDLKDSVKIIKNSEKPYIINKKWIIWPILPNVEAKIYTFNSLEANEYFIDAKELNNDIILLTNFSKIVKFTNNWHFEYSDVINQNIWEKSKEINSYNSNIYLLGKENNQIFKHTKNWNDFSAAKWYLKKDDLTQIWEILSIAIDWSFYILKKDLSIIKFYSSPYRIEKISINNLPENYNIEDENSVINLKTKRDLNYVYLLMNNKVWVFKPNTQNYTDTKSLTYIWQIEWDTNTIKDFYINYDWEILILNNKWIYKLNFEISDDRIIIR